MYLPDDLYALLKEGGMSASQLLQGAVREEARRQELCSALDAYLAEMDALYDPPSEEERAAAEAWAAEVAAAVTRASDDDVAPPTRQAVEPSRGRATRRRRAS